MTFHSMAIEGAIVKSIWRKDNMIITQKTERLLDKSSGLMVEENTVEGAAITQSGNHGVFILGKERCVMTPDSEVTKFFFAVYNNYNNGNTK